MGNKRFQTKLLIVNYYLGEIQVPQINDHILVVVIEENKSSITMYTTSTFNNEKKFRLQEQHDKQYCMRIQDVSEWDLLAIFI